MASLLIFITYLQYSEKATSKTSSLDGWNATVAESTATDRVGHSGRLMVGKKISWLVL
jgi:hypothetical protein